MSKILPGSGQIILNEFILEGHHRREIEQQLVQHSMSISSRAQIFALALGVIGLGGGIALCSLGNNMGGLGMVGGSLAALVGAFLKSHANEKAAAEQEAPKPKPAVAPRPSADKSKKAR